MNDLIQIGYYWVRPKDCYIHQDNNTLKVYSRHVKDCLYVTGDTTLLQYLIDMLNVKEESPDNADIEKSRNKIILNSPIQLLSICENMKIVLLENGINKISDLSEGSKSQLKSKISSFYEKDGYAANRAITLIIQALNEIGLNFIDSEVKK